MLSLIFPIKSSKEINLLDIQVWNIGERLGLQLNLRDIN